VYLRVTTSHGRLHRAERGRIAQWTDFLATVLPGAAMLRLERLFAYLPRPGFAVPLNPPISAT
jgi:hypothetical protein